MEFDCYMFDVSTTLIKIFSKQSNQSKKINDCTQFLIVTIKNDNKYVTYTHNC